MSQKLADLLTIYPESWKHSNTYYLNLGGGVLIDPGMPRPKDFDFDLHYIFATHGHYDHLMGIDSWLGAGQEFFFPEADVWMLNDQEANASKMFANARNFPQPAHRYKDGDIFSLESGYQLRIFATPGHTGGSSCLILEHHDNGLMQVLGVFCGDTVFSSSIGRTDLLAGDPNAMRETVGKVKVLLDSLPDETPFFPGHGPATTVERLKAVNPYFKEQGLKV